MERLRAHQEGLRRKLKTQSDKKTRLEVCVCVCVCVCVHSYTIHVVITACLYMCISHVLCLCKQSDLQKYQHRMQSLQTHSAHQTKVLRIKTQEASPVQCTCTIMYTFNISISLCTGLSAWSFVVYLVLSL